MNLDTFFKLSTNYYRSGLSYYLTSAPGRGKTTTLEACPAKIASDLGKTMGFVLLNGPNLNVMDMQGYLMPTRHPDGRIESRYSDPFWFVTREGKRLEEYDGGIIVIDEADKMDQEVKKIAGEMAQSGRCGTHTLPPGWVVWMAGNRAGDRSGSTKELDHLINRRGEIKITDDLAGWEKWATRNGVHHSIIAFAVNNAQVVFPESLPEKQGPYCTPRSIVACGKALATFVGKDEPLPVHTDAVETAAGFIGDAAAAQLFATLRLDGELPTMEAIIKAPGTCKLPSKADAQMLVAYKLSRLVTEATLAPVIQYIERLPADFSVTFAKSLATRDVMMVTKPAMMAWTQRNASLMSLVAALKK